jgi:hypothetical protein
MGVFEGPEPWGPWSTVYYAENFLGLGSRGSMFSINFPLSWQSGPTLWATFSCHNGGAAGACGKYHDRLGLIRATLQTSSAGS